MKNKRDMDIPLILSFVGVVMMFIGFIMMIGQLKQDISSACVQQCVEQCKEE